MKHPITGLAHIGLHTADIERSARFYESLGFVRQEELTVEAVRICYLAQSGAVIELYQLNDTCDGKYPVYGLDHIAFYINDLDAALEWVSRLGYRVTEGPNMQPSGENGVRYFMITGPDGEQVEFDQRL